MMVHMHCCTFCPEMYRTVLPCWIYSQNKNLKLCSGIIRRLPIATLMHIYIRTHTHTHTRVHTHTSLSNSNWISFVQCKQPYIYNYTCIYIIRSVSRSVFCSASVVPQEMLCKTATMSSSVRESERCTVMDGRMFLNKCPTKMGLAKKTVILLSVSVSTCIGQFNSMSVDSHTLAALGVIALI